jgi:hypothetical protein
VLPRLGAPDDEHHQGAGYHQEHHTSRGRHCWS